MSLNLGIIASSRASAPAVSLLLDTYPGAAAAYSLRKLRTAYAGSAIRVRRSSDNAETDIGFNGSNQLNTTALLTFCGVSSGFISIWYDQSGNSNNLIQSTLSKQPQIVSSGSYLGYIVWDGVATELRCNTSSVVWNGSSNALFTTVTAPDTATPNQGFEGASTINVPETGSWGGIYQTVGPTFLKWRFGTSQNNSDETYTRVNSTDFCIVNTHKNSTTENLYLNNSLVKTATGKLSTIANTSSTTYVDGFGIIFYWKGNQKEIVLYATNQTSNISGINTNINTFYSIY
jgi:hypothetical protein